MVSAAPTYPGHHVEWSWLTPGRAPTGEGAFFKPHKDTPRGQSMFGSLVVVFPTPHEGGALVLRHSDEEFTFDAAALLSKRPSSIAYVAFFSDVEHEVLPVVSGHRVTLTYNLFFGQPAPSSGLEVLRPLHTNASAVKDALAALLDDVTFMPRGGTLGFGLRHHYPFPKAWTRRMESPLKSLRAWLKGSDAALFAACAGLGVEPLLRLVCKGDKFEEAIVLERMEELGEYVVSAEETLLMRGGERVHGYTFTGDKGHPWESEDAGFGDGEGEGDGEEDEDEDGLTVHWLTEASSEDGPSSAYAAYGNEASLDWLYTGVCLLVEIGPYGDRSGESDASE